VSVTWLPSAGMACHDPVRRNALFALYSVMTFLRIVITLYFFDLSMIFSENRYPLFRIML